MKADGLKWSYFQTDIDDLLRTPALISGSYDAILVDAGFTFATGRRLVAEIASSGKRLSCIFITCADPDYYFSLAPIRAAFPNVPVYATATTVHAIRETVAHKIDVWAPTLGENGPRSLTDAVIPEVWPSSILKLEDEVIEILTAKQNNRFSLWIPSLATILGGVQIVSGIHVWMADTPTKIERFQWIESLDEMQAKPLAEALPGHMTPGSRTGRAAIEFTRNYLIDFEEELGKAPDATTLISNMTARYPELAMKFVLDLGAKVCMGEAKWP